MVTKRPPSKGERRVLDAIGVSPGIVIGKAHLLTTGPVHITHAKIDEAQVSREVRRFRRALKEAKDGIQAVREGVRSEELRKHLFILDTHIMILEDRMIAEDTVRIIRTERLNAESALTQQIEKLKAMFDAIEDPYLRERKADIDQVGQRVLRRLVGEPEQVVAEIPDKSVIIAHDLSPADTAQMTADRVAGFLTNVGGPTSHTAIMARAIEIPAVVGLERITSEVRNGCPIIVDGRAGRVILYPSRDDYADYLRRLERFHRFEQELLKDLHLPAETLDHHRMSLAANIEMNREIPSVLEHGGEGVGLYRTEYLYMNRDTLPSEDEHYAVYREVAERTAPHSATIRTVDLGGDKFLSRFELASETNPALGLRGIRLCLHDRDLFKVQLRGILRASAHGKLRVMLPLISGLPEVRIAKEVLEEVKHELTKRGEPFDEQIPIGCMVETPSSVVIVDLLARESDFLSIGTNDLIQYTLAIDRVNEHVAPLYEPSHPAILRMLRHVFEAAKVAEVPVSLCGEMAGDLRYTMVLIGLGLQSFSMTPHSIPVVKRVVRSVTRAECQALVAELLEMDHAAVVDERIRREVDTRYPELMGVE